MKRKAEKELNILVIDHCFLIGFGLEYLVSSKLNCIFHFAPNFHEAIEIMNAVYIDVLFIDYSEGIYNQSEEIKRLKEINQDVKIIVFSNIDVNSINNYSLPHADLLLSKKAKKKTLINAVAFVLKKENIRTSKDTIIVKFEKEKGPSRINLSEREYQIAKMLVSGDRIIKISESLQIKKSTVCTYKKRIFQKLRIRNTIQLLKIFKDKGLNFSS